MNERGSALVAVLGLTMLLLPLGAFVVLQCRTDFMIQRNLRGEIEAFQVAEAGLEHALSEIAPGGAFDGVLAGPDGIAGNGDDGVFPFTEGWPAEFPQAPFRYDVRVTASGLGGMRLTSYGSGAGGSSKNLEALVVRSPLPYTPAALYVETALTNVELGAGGFEISGFDHRSVDQQAVAGDATAPLPALSSPSAEWEGLLRQRLSTSVAGLLTGNGGAPSIATAPALDLQPYAARVINRTEATRVSGAPAPSLLGTTEAPQLSVISGDLDVVNQLSGSGVLVVDGALHVSGTFDFSGLVLALGAIVFEPSSTVEVVGAVWRAASQDERLGLQGRGAIVYGSAALAQADRAFPGVLPHAAVATGWHEPL